MYKFNKKSALILALFGIFSLTGCASKQKIEQKDEPIKEVYQTDPASNISAETTHPKELALDANKCIGCGRCAGIAPSNFAMTNRKAKIISQENLVNENVQKAIVSCPVNIITLN